MLSDFIFSLEPYVLSLYLAHAIISLVLAIFLSVYVMKRFVNNDEVKEKDKGRLEEISQESWIFRQLFKVSLHKNNRLTNILFMFLFNFSMPFVGYPFAIWITLYLKHVKYEKRAANTNILNLDEFGMSFLKTERIFGEGSMGDLMLNEYAPKSKKLKALSALSNNASPANLKIIRQTLSSTDDEIRMFGYAIINKAEKSLNVKINKNLEKYNSEKNKTVDQDKEKMAEAAKELAPLYWEMIYTELSHDSLKDNFMKEVQKYTLIAKEFYAGASNELDEISDTLEKRIKEVEEIPTKKERNKYKEEVFEHQKELMLMGQKAKKYKEIKTRLFILMGRLYMSQKKYESAKEEFTQAQQLHEEQLAFVLPYLAEISFLTGNYTAVASIMNKAKDLELNATLYPIVEQWKSAS